jgi:mRNA interferase RelE/StbE
MSSYRIVFAGNSKKDLDKLDRVVRQRIAKKLQYFLEQDDPLVYARQLVHSSIGGYRFRIGHYRVIFDLDCYTIQVLSVKHRGEVYRG